MAEVPPEPIETPANEDIEPLAFGVSQQLIEGGTAILRPAHTLVGVLDSRPPSRPDVSPELQQLVLRLLINGRDTGVNGGPHQSAPASRNEKYASPSVGSMTI